MGVVEHAPVAPRIDLGQDVAVTEPRRKRRVLRIFLKIFLVLLALVVLLGVTALILAAHLEFGPVKGIIQSQAKKRGIDLDFDKAGATLGGVHMKNVRIHSADVDRGLAPDLISIGSIDGDWSPFKKRVDNLVIKDVVLTLVVNDDGTTSLDHWLAGFPPSPPDTEPAKALSAVIDKVLPEGIEAHVKVEGVSVRLIPSGKAKPVSLDGLAVAVDLAGGKLHAAIGPAELHLAVGDKTAAAKLGITVDLGDNQVGLGVQLDLVSQTFAPTLPPVTKIADVSAKFTFVPGEHRTRLELERLSLLDGKASFGLTADVFDDGASLRPVVHDATCTVDAAAIAKQIPADLGLGAIELEADPFHCTGKELEVVPGPKGDLGLTGKIAKLDWRDIHVRDVLLDVGLHPEKNALAAKVKLQAGSVKMTGTVEAFKTDVDLTATLTPTIWPVATKARISAGAVAMPGKGVRGLKLSIDGTATSASAFSGTTTVDVDSVVIPGTDVRDAHLEAKLDDIALAPNTLESTGRVALGGRAGSVATAGKSVKGAVFSGGATLAGKSSTAFLNLDAENVATGVPDFPGGKTHLELDVTRLALDTADPARSRVEAKVKAAVGANTVAGTVAGSATPLDASWDLSAAVDKAGPARGVKLVSKGRYGGTIDHDTTIDLGKLVLTNASFRDAHIHVKSKGTMRRQDADVTAAINGLRVAGNDLGSPRVQLVVAADLDKPRVDARIKASSPETDLHLVAEIDGARVARYTIDGKVGALGPAIQFLPPGPEWNKVSVTMQGKGAIAGIVKSVQNGIPVLVADPAASARGNASLDIEVRGIHYKGAAETESRADSISVKASAELAERRKVNVDIAAPGLDATASGVRVAVKNLAVHLDADVDKNGAGATSLSVKADEIQQSAVILLPVKDLDIQVKLQGDPQTSMSLLAKVKNPGAGTTLDLSGQLDRRVAGADAIPDRNSFILQGQLDQNLELLNGDPTNLRAGGQLSVPFRVESGDLTVFRANAQVKLAKVSIDLPKSKIHIGGIDGDIPILEEIVKTPAGMHPVGRGERGLYPQLRFVDQSPFLGNANYLSVAEITWNMSKFGPIAGNIRVDRDVFSLDQLEMSALGGKITGQCLAELNGRDTSLTFRGKITGIHPTLGGDVLDANLALTLTPYKLGLEGRIEMVRIGKQHLLDLLDLYDPYHADVTANQVRLGLKFGYPKQVRLGFIRGFASLAVELGGIAGIVSISEISGVPIGPVLESYLAPILETK